jgi:glycosyltransferase involved in cell wall biosynthesis
MRVLFLTWWYPTADRPQLGVFVREHARAASRAGADVVVLHIPDGPFRGRGLWSLEREQDRDLTDGIATYRLSSRSIRVPFSRRLSFWASYALHVGAVAVAILRLRRRGFHPDVIHAHVFVAGAVGVAVGRLLRLPIVISEHSTMFVRRVLSPGMERRARYAFARAARVLPVSVCLREAIVAYGMQARFEVVSNAVDPAIFRPPDPRQRRSTRRRSRRMLFVGGLEPTEHKGFPTLISALGRIALRHRDWQLDVVGDGPSRRDYEARVRACGLGDRVVFHGYRPKPAIAELMRAADVFVLPSKFETQGVVFLEAMMCGLPIVSTTAGSIPEVVGSESGILVEPDDDLQLAEAIEDVVYGPATFDTAAVAESAARRYSLEVVGAELVRIYEAVTA